MIAAVEEAVRDIVHVRHWGDTSFVSFPIYYPSGSPVTLRIMQSGAGFRVDDAGFAYREIEAVGFERSFASAADKARAAEGICRDRRLLFLDVSADCLGRALSDVAIASWNVADRVFGRISDQEERDIEDYLRERLTAIFGGAGIDEHQTIVGSSASPWEVSAVVHTKDEIVVFQAVSPHANSVYRTSTAFHDIAALPNPPRLVAVVKDRNVLGHKLAILSQAGRVIQSDEPDDVYLRAAA
jgi:hypothetical protein